ncbi:MAG: DUF3090 family protein [Chloroflexota bacterium]
MPTAPAATTRSRCRSPGDPARWCPPCPDASTTLLPGSTPAGSSPERSAPPATPVLPPGPRGHPRGVRLAPEGRSRGARAAQRGRAARGLERRGIEDAAEIEGEVGDTAALDEPLNEAFRAEARCRSSWDTVDEVIIFEARELTEDEDEADDDDDDEDRPDLFRVRVEAAEARRFVAAPSAYSPPGARRAAVRPAPRPAGPPLPAAERPPLN